RPLDQSGGQSLAVEKLHDQEVRSILLADVEQRADVRMRQRRDGPSLALETFAERSTGCHMGRQNFDGHGAIEPRIARAKDLSHAAGANGGDHFIRSESGSRLDEQGLLEEYHPVA